EIHLRANAGRARREGEAPAEPLCQPGSAGASPSRIPSWPLHVSGGSALGRVPFLAQDAHQQQVVVSAVAPDVRPLAPFLHKSTGPVGLDGTRVGRMHAQPHLAIVQIPEGILEQQANALTPVALPPVILVADADPELAGLRRGVRVEERTRPDALAIDLDRE